LAIPPTALLCLVGCFDCRGEGPKPDDTPPFVPECKFVGACYSPDGRDSKDVNIACHEWTMLTKEDADVVALAQGSCPATYYPRGAHPSSALAAALS